MNTLLYIPPSDELTKFIKDNSLQAYNIPVLVGEDLRKEFIKQFDTIKNIINTELAKFNTIDNERLLLTAKQTEEVQRALDTKRLFIDLAAMGENNLDLIINNFGLDTEDTNYLTQNDKLFIKKGYLSAHYSNQCILPNTLIPYVSKSLWDIFGDDINEFFKNGYGGLMFDPPLSDYNFDIVYEKGRFYQVKKKYIQWWIGSKNHLSNTRSNTFGFTTKSKFDDRVTYTILKSEPWEATTKSFGVKTKMPQQPVSVLLKDRYNQILKEIWTILKLRDSDLEGNLSFTLTKSLDLWSWSLFEKKGPRITDDPALANKPKPVLVPSAQAYLNDWNLFQKAYALPCKTYIVEGKVHRIQYTYYDPNQPSIPFSAQPLPEEQLHQQRERDFVYSQEQRIAALDALCKDLDKCDENGILIEINVAHNAFD